jgi:hypothetical protein
VWLWGNVGLLAVVGLKGLLVLTALATHRLSRCYAPGHPAHVRVVRSERALPRHQLPMGIATSAAEVERRGVRG